MPVTPPKGHDLKAELGAAHPAAPRFAAVELRPPTPTGSPAASSIASSAPPSAIMLTLRLPHGIESSVTGLDADAVTLLVLELVGATTRAAGVPACSP